MAINGPLKAVPGSAEYLESQLSGPELSCRHFPKYRAEEDHRYPSRLGFFSSDPEPKITYLDTKKLCIACLVATVPDGFNYIPPSTPATSAPLPIKTPELPSQVFQAGHHRLNRGSQPVPTPSHLIAPPVSIDLAQSPWLQHGWSWMKSQRKPFYVDALYPLNDRPPIVRAIVTRDAEIATHSGTPYAGQIITLNSTVLQTEFQQSTVTSTIKQVTVKKKESEDGKKKKTATSTTKAKPQDTNRGPKSTSSDIPPVPTPKVAANLQNDLGPRSPNTVSLSKASSKEATSTSISSKTVSTTGSVQSKPRNGTSDTKLKAETGLKSEGLVKSGAHSSAASSVIPTAKITEERHISSSITNWQDLMMPMPQPTPGLDTKAVAGNVVNTEASLAGKISLGQAKPPGKDTANLTQVRNTSLTEVCIDSSVVTDIIFHRQPQQQQPHGQPSHRRNSQHLRQANVILQRTGAATTLSHFKTTATYHL